MAFCTNCGRPLDENTNVCTFCNPQAEQSATDNGNQGSSSQGSSSQGTYSQGTASKENFFQKLTNTPDTTAEYDPKDIADNKLLALLSYIGILVLIPMFVAPNSKFTRYHVRQGFTLFLADVGVAIINYLLGLIKVTRYIWGIPYQTTPGIIGFISWILGIPLFCLSIIGIINAYQGKAMELPFIGKIQIIK